jgi:hypothetical protein
MLRQLPNTWWLIGGITILSILLVQLGGKGMLEITKSNRTGLAFGYLFGGVIFGLVAIQAYLWMAQAWPANTASIYLWTAIGVSAMLTVAAIGMIWVVRDVRTVGIWIALNLLWGLGYGWFIPRLVAAS